MSKQQWVGVLCLVFAGVCAAAVLGQINHTFLPQSQPSVGDRLYFEVQDPLVVALAAQSSEELKTITPYERAHAQWYRALGAQREPLGRLLVQIQHARCQGGPAVWALHNEAYLRMELFARLRQKHAACSMQSVCAGQLLHQAQRDARHIVRDPQRTQALLRVLDGHPDAARALNTCDLS